MKKKYSLIGLVMMALISCGMIACSSGDDGDGGLGSKAGENNTTDLAVTGSVQATGMTFATIKGFINFSVPEAYANLGDVYSYGVEYAKNVDFSDAQYAHGGSVAGRAFTATLKGLTPNTKYYYRTYLDNMRGTQTGTFTTKECSYDGTVSASCSDVQFWSARFKGAISNPYLQNETFTIGIALSKHANGFNSATYKNAYFNGSEYYSSDKDILRATVNGTTFLKYKNSGELFDLVYNELESGVTYYYAAFIDIGGEVIFSSTQTVTARKLKGNTFNSGTYTWTTCNIGAESPFEEGTDYKNILNNNSVDTGLSSTLNLPPLSIVDELNSCKREVIYNDDIPYGVVLTDRYGNEMYLPLGYYITSGVYPYTLYSSKKNYFREKFRVLSDGSIVTVTYNSFSFNIVEEHYDGKYRPGEKVMIREVW